MVHSPPNPDAAMPAGILGGSGLQAIKKISYVIVNMVDRKVHFYIFTIMACGYERKWRLHLVQPPTFGHRKHRIASKLN